MGRVVDGAVAPVGEPPPRPPRARGEPASDVALIATYPGIGAAPLMAAVDAGAAGVVLVGAVGAVGAISARGLSGPKARPALMVALGAGNPAGVRRWFDDL